MKKIDQKSEASYVRIAVDNTTSIEDAAAYQKRFENADKMRETTSPVSSARHGFPEYSVYKAIADALVDTRAMKYNGVAVSYYPASHVGYALAAIEQSYGEGLQMCQLIPEAAAEFLVIYGEKDTGIGAILNSGVALATKSRLYRQDMFGGRF